jgi:hypothetical protein
MRRDGENGGEVDSPNWRRFTGRRLDGQSCPPLAAFQVLVPSRLGHRRYQRQASPAQCQQVGARFTQDRRVVGAVVDGEVEAGGAAKWGSCQRRHASLTTGFATNDPRPGMV